MSVIVKHIVISIIIFIQSRKSYRKLGKKLLKNLEISEPSEKEYFFVQKRIDQYAKYFSKVNNPNVNKFVERLYGRVIRFVELVNRTSDNCPQTGYWLFSLFTMHILLRGSGIGEALCNY